MKQASLKFVEFDHQKVGTNHREKDCLNAMIDDLYDLLTQKRVLEKQIDEKVSYISSRYHHNKRVIRKMMYCRDPKYLVRKLAYDHDFDMLSEKIGFKDQDILGPKWA